MDIGICRLCLLEKPLITKSHIIPDFMYQNVKDKNEKMHIFSPSAIARGQDEKIRYAQTGAFDKNILCEKCDNEAIGQYESYASKIIYAKPGEIKQHLAPVVTNYEITKGLRFSRCSNIDYTKFKLFLLSILWRASISKHYLFDQVHLGPHEDPIREMLYNNDPKTVFDYPILQLHFKNRDMPSIIGQPRRQKMSPTGTTVYHFIIDKSIFVFALSTSYHHAPNFVQEFTVKPDNEMSVIHLEGKAGMEILFAHFGVKYIS